MLHASKEQAQKPIPKIPRFHQITIRTTSTKGIENIPQRQPSFISRVRKIFSSRLSNSIVRQGSTKQRPPALNLSSSLRQRVQAPIPSEEEEEEDDIRRPSGLGRPVSISSLPPSPFSPSYKNNIFMSNSLFGNGDHLSDSDSSEEETGQATQSHMPSRARTVSSPNLFLSDLRSTGSRRPREGRSTWDSRISSRVGTRCIQYVQLQSDALVVPQLPEIQDVASVTISSMPIETIAHIFTFIPKSSIARMSHTCQLFFFASQTVLYTHINLDDFESESQQEKFFTLLSERQDYTDLVKSFRCVSWPQFFLQTTKSPLSSRLPHGESSLTMHPFFPPDRQDQGAQYHNTLLTATFTLVFQRMSNLTSLILPAYDHDLLGYHTAFALREITFLCSTMSKEEGRMLFGWLDGQLNITRLEFPNLFVIDGDLDHRSWRDEVNQDKKSMEKSKTARPATSSGTVRSRQVSGSVTMDSRGGGKKYQEAPYPVPLDYISSFSPSYAPLGVEHRTSTLRTNPRDPQTKPSSRPKTASPDSPSYTTFYEAAAASSDTNASTTSPSHILFPHPPSAPYPLPVSPLSSPTLLPNLSILQGPPCLVTALSSPTALFSAPTSPTSHPPAVGSKRPLYSISLNINTTIYSGLRPASIMTQLVGVAWVLNLRFGEAVDKRSIEKVLAAAGSSLGGTRERVDMDEREKKGWEGRSRRTAAGEIKDGFKFGRGEWKGLTELNVELTAGGPRTDQVRCLVSRNPDSSHILNLGIPSNDIFSYTTIPLSSGFNTQLYISWHSIHCWFYELADDEWTNGEFGFSSCWQYPIHIPSKHFFAFNYTCIILRHLWIYFFPFIHTYDCKYNYKYEGHGIA